jgi:hypothetical protein
MASYSTSYLPDDEEEERRAEIERLTSGFGTEFAAGMAEGGIDIGAGDPEPVDPRAGLPAPVAHGTGNGGLQPLPMMDEDFGGVTPAAPNPQQMARATGAQPPRQVAPRPQPQPSDPNLPSVDADQSGQFAGQLSGLDEQQRRERRRRGIISAIFSPFMGGAEGANAFINQNAPQYDQRREQIGTVLTAHREQRAAQQRARQTAIQQMLEQRQQQANADRTFGQRSAELEYQQQRDAARDAQSASEFDRSENMRAKRDELNRQAAAGRTRDIAGAMTGRSPSAPTAPVDPSAPPNPRSVIDAASEQDDFLVREAAAYLTSRGVDLESPEGQEAYARLVQQGMSRTGRAREQFVDNLRSSEGRGMQGARDERTADRQDVAATADYIAAAENAEGAAASLERLIASSGSIGARAMRGEGFLADAAAAIAGPQAETDRSQWREYLGNLLHERGGAALTEQEKAVIQSALNSNSWLNSPDATIAMLRRLATRARREAAGRVTPRRGPGSGPATPVAPSGGSAPPPTVTRNGVTYQLRNRDSQGRYVYVGPNGEQIAARPRGGQ